MTYAEIAPPPLSSGAAQDNVAAFSATLPAILRTTDGALNAVGVASAILLGELIPAELIAFTRNLYVVFPTKPVSVAVVAVLTERAMRDQVEPESVDDSIA